MISTVLEEFLLSLYDFHYLIVRQFQVHQDYSPRSYTTITSHLNALARDHYLQTTSFRWQAHFGRPTLVYLLARRGINYLRDVHQLYDGRRFHPNEEKDHNPLFLKHTVEVNDFLISAHQLCKHNPTVTLKSWLHERSMKGKKLVVEDQDGEDEKSKKRNDKIISTIFDGWLDFWIKDSQGKTTSFPIALELDRGTENQTVFRQKCRAILLAYHQSYPQLFNTSDLTLAVVTTHSEKRKLELLRWIEAELQDLGQIQRAELFRVIYCQPHLLPPEELFLSPLWNRPGTSAQLPLLGR